MNDTIILFPLSEYWWFYIVFTLGVLGMLALDLGVFHRKAHAVRFREAAGWSVFWVALAMLFCWGFWHYADWKFANNDRIQAWLLQPDVAAQVITEATLADKCALEFLTGYVVEKALSVDNIFVFVLAFNFFGIPALYQHRVLFYGILGALVFRSIFIALGAALMQFHWVIWIFGIFLILTGVKILVAPEKAPKPEKNPIVRLLRKFLPIEPQLQNNHFFVRKDGALHGTMLLVCLAFIEVSDIIFAVDSVPAIFAITKEPLIVFTSNIFAILGLRAMFFLLASVMHRFHLLKYGLGIILIFVGLKMVWIKVPIAISLSIICGILLVSVILSLLFPSKAAPHVDGAATH